MMMDKIISAIIGAMIGVITFVFAGYIEGEKQFEIKKAESLVKFFNNTWGSENDSDLLSYTRTVSEFTVYAPSEVLGKFSTYVSRGCASAGDPPQCQELWADVVNETRRSLGERAVDTSTIITALWGKPQAGGN